MYRDTTKVKQEIITIIIFIITINQLIIQNQDNE